MSVGDPKYFSITIENEQGVSVHSTGTHSTTNLKFVKKPAKRLIVSVKF